MPLGPKLTWKEATLRYLKLFTANNKDPYDKTNLNIFTLKRFTAAKIDHIVTATRSRAKNPEGTLMKTMRELRDFKLVRSRSDLGIGVYEFISGHDNEELIFKEKRSIGHLRIAKCLTRMKIPYEEEKTFEDLVHRSFLKLDFYLMWCNRKIAIEYDGIQHQKAIPGWGGDESLSEGQKRDMIKNEYCAENGIMLLRIPHDTKDVEGAIETFLANIMNDSIARFVMIKLIDLYLKLSWKRKLVTQVECFPTVLDWRLDTLSSLNKQ